MIRVFLRSIAKNWDGKLIAIIVSGYDSDGSAALSDIKQAGAITIAQKLDTAKQPGVESFARRLADIAHRRTKPHLSAHHNTRRRSATTNLCNLIDIKPDPLGKRKTIVDCKKSVVPTDSV